MYIIFNVVSFDIDHQTAIQTLAFIPSCKSLNSLYSEPEHERSHKIALISISPSIYISNFSLIKILSSILVDKNNKLCVVKMFKMPITSFQFS